ncbi:hypothetical protein ASPCAL12815 [Aspergillus calidoustus]|uniref:Uncharacterized protein n=1 Tax=Aspergillus calidoustus TaxID=454130 RepID=A0A0U5GBJ3_ASPCI|nr:hypothetical protein ASPCAL12815 [Aspergillus calidoustus]
MPTNPTLSMAITITKLTIPNRSPLFELHSTSSSTLATTVVPSPDRVIRRLSKKWRKLRDKTAKYKDAEAILDELELFLHEEMLAGVDETLESLVKDLKDDDPEVKKKFGVLISTLAELMREHARNNAGDLEELERVLEVTKRWPKEGMTKTKTKTTR